MRDFIIEIYSGLLQVTVVVTTGIGFFIGYSDLLGDETSVSRGLLFATISFIFSAISTGHLFTQIRIKELLEEQLHYLKAHKKPATRQRPQQDEKKCPYCAELVRVEATACRFCGRDLAVPLPSQAPAAPKPSSERKEDLEPVSVAMDELDQFLSSLGYQLAKSNEKWTIRYPSGAASHVYSIDRLKSDVDSIARKHGLTIDWVD